MKFIKRFGTEEGYKDFTKGEEVIVADFSAEQLQNEILNTYFISRDWIEEHIPTEDMETITIDLPEDKTDVYLVFVFAGDSVTEAFGVDCGIMMPAGLLSSVAAELIDILGGKFEYTDEHFVIDCSRMRLMFGDGSDIVYILMKDGIFLEDTNEFAPYIKDIWGLDEDEHVTDTLKVENWMYYTPNGVVSDRAEIERIYKEMLDNPTEDNSLTILSLNEGEMSYLPLTRENLNSFTTDEKIMIARIEMR